MLLLLFFPSFLLSAYGCCFLLGFFGFSNGGGGGGVSDFQTESEAESMAVKIVRFSIGKAVVRIRGCRRLIRGGFW